MRHVNSRFRSIIAAVVLPMYLASCTSWQVQELAPAQVLQQEQPTKVRVTRTSSQFVLENPAISGDTLSGFVKQPSALRSVLREVFTACTPFEPSISCNLLDDGLRLSIPASSVDEVAVRGTNALLTAALVVGLAAVGFGVLIIAACSSESEGGCR